eukprot:jgi/Bigna1/134611/aug1.26_g9319
MRALIDEIEGDAHAKNIPISFYFEGMAPIMADIKQTMYASAPYYMGATIGLVVLFLTIISFRSAFIGVRLMATVAFSLAWVFGLVVILLQDIRISHSEGDGVHFIVPIVCVPVLVGLTLDYDLFLLVRIFEYRMKGYSTKDATVVAMYNTSGIITTAGLIMIIAFSSLMSAKQQHLVESEQFSDLLILKTTGILITVTCFVDTFIVPAILMIGAEANWWPGRVPKITKQVHILRSRLHPRSSISKLR